MECYKQGNVSKTYTFEKGTTLNINGSDIIGTVTLTATPGNLNDTATLTFKNTTENNKIEQFTISKEISCNDVLETNLTYTQPSEKTKTYIYILTTNKNGVSDSQQGSVNATVKINTFQYFYFLSGDSLPSGKTFEGNSITAYKTTGKTWTYKLGTSKKYLYMLSPNKVTEIETAAGVTESSANTYFVTTGWEQEEVNYTPIGGGTGNNM